MSWCFVPLGRIWRVLEKPRLTSVNVVTTELQEENYIVVVLLFSPLLLPACTSSLPMSATP